MGGRIKTDSTGGRRRKKKKKKTAHAVIFINAEPSRQVLVLELLLDLNERARGRRGHQDVRM